MENVSKALIISAGILFAVLVLTLLVIFFNQISSYYSEQNKAKMIEQITEFNSKFDNYSETTIRGNELISVMNKVVDYNRIYSEEGAERITISVDLQGHQKDLLYTGTPNSDIIFSKTMITNGSGNDDEVGSISGLATQLANDSGIQETKLQKLSAEISHVCDEGATDSDKKDRNEKIAKILGYNKNKTFSDTEIKNIQSATRKYYQLTQFKRTMFKCTEVVHGQKDGKINRISFEAVIDNGMLKFN